MDSIKNIFCVGRNFVEHVHELKNVVPDAPVIFSKPTHAITKADGKIIELPSDKGVIHYEAELVVKLVTDYVPGATVDALIGEMTIGLDLTMREVQQRLKDKGYPWLLSKGFPHSAILGDFIKFPGLEACKEENFSLLINDNKVQEGNIQQMIFNLETLILFIGENIGLRQGDIIFTGTPSGVGVLKNDDYLTLKWGTEEVGDCTVKCNN